MKGVIISIVVAAFLIGGAIVLSGSSGSDPIPSDGSNVKMEQGTQVIEIQAKGGYSPRKTVAKAGIPTVIRMKTRGTFDCSSALVIPSIGYRNYLPQSGTTDIPIPAQEVGTTMQGLCSMGMYSFAISFN